MTNLIWAPIIFTVVICTAAIAKGLYDDLHAGGDYFTGISAIFYLVPALFASMISWIIYGICK